MEQQKEALTPRGTWSRKIEFYLATLGYAVGTGAMLRFPYLVFKNGGGAFLIPFIIFMIIGGFPLFYMELLIGQFNGRSPLTLFSAMCPAMKGLGHAMTVLSGMLSINYMSLPYAVFYLVASMAADVPWRSCNNEWNSERCFDQLSAASNSTIFDLKPVSPTEEYWNNHVLGIGASSGIGDLGNLRWQITLANFACWVIVFGCTCLGAASTGKVVYVTATMPYFLLFALFIRGVTLPGSLEGIIFYLYPEPAKLLDYNVWLEAAIQVFYALGPCWGGIITMASYNGFHDNCIRAAITLTCLQGISAIFSGFAVFSVLGFMAHQYGLKVSDVATSGPGLSFVAYPAAIAEMPIAPLWAILFFLTLITLTIDSQFGMFDTMVSGFLDAYPTFRQTKLRKVSTTAAFATVWFLLALPLCTEGGMYIFQIIDWYSAILALALIGLLECITVAYIYGMSRFDQDVTLMLNRGVYCPIKYTWLYLMPVLMAGLLIVMLVGLTPPIYGYTEYVYPDWAIALGWISALIPIAPIPFFFILKVFVQPLFQSRKDRSKTYCELAKLSFKASRAWVPNCSELIEPYIQKWYSREKTSQELKAIDNEP